MTKKEEFEKKKFLSFVNKTSSCWNWTGSLSLGYGYFSSLLGNSKRAHRASYEIFIGKISPDMMICHKCDNKACVNPKHLYQGTHADNTRDAVERNRMARGVLVHAAKLNPSKIRKIKNLLSLKVPQRKIAKMFSVSQRNISSILKNESWAYIKTKEPKKYMTFTQLKKHLGIAFHTIRKWERSGKIKNCNRTKMGWRFYLPEDVKRIEKVMDKWIPYAKRQKGKL